MSLGLILFIVSILGILVFGGLLLWQRLTVHKKEVRILQEIEAEYHRRKWMQPPGF